MSPISFTEEQRRAIQSVGRNVIVSAAAGAGKTAVLAERCAFLVCDAPPPHRCDADALLVLTFTDAAAAEMRERVIAAIRRRSRDNPSDPRLRDQAARVEAAQISTIHSFCLTLIRRWFTELDIDPSATVMNEPEAGQLRRQALQELFTELYERDRRARSASDPATSADANAKNAPSPPVSDADASGDSSGPLWRSFTALVDDYGLGDDRAIAEFVLRAHAFTRSLPDPEAWLADAMDVGPRRLNDAFRRYAAALAAELDLQRDHVGMLLEDRRVAPGFEPRLLQPIEAYHAALESWLLRMRTGLDKTTTELPLSSAFNDLVVEAAEFKFLRAAARRKGDAPEVLEATAVARDDLASLREGFRKRIRNRFLRFTRDELFQDVRRTAPHVRAIVELVAALESQYAKRKRSLGLLDFSDLERLAYQLLRGAEVSTAARPLRRRFAHVLVDEFQDINPLQLALITLAARGQDGEGGGNLFVVGDVKQSIYRFRLAEPILFVERVRRYREPSAAGEALTLRTNFRSRPEILEAVNRVFRALMTHGDFTYDKQAELRPGRACDDQANPSRVELHVLDARWPAPARSAPAGSGEDAGESDAPSNDDDARSDDANEPWDNAPGLADPTGPRRWSREEREAFVIASRIRAWRDADEPVVDGRAPRFEEIAVLLRSLRHSAERMAAMLRRFGVPAAPDAGASLLAAVEVRDVLAALRLLDNAAQDIPLASVLRSGVLNERLTPRELAEIRLSDRDAAFHEAATAYARRGEDEALRRRMADFHRRVERLRDAVRRRPLSDVVWELIEAGGYLARTMAMPNGVQRRANLLCLHELARSFGEFRRQGLRRFLDFVDGLADEGQSIDVGAPAGDAHGAVRILSVHKAKGLEFPVVFLAGLGRAFNQEDVRGRMLFERSSRIGLRVVDPDRLTEHPSLLHRLVVAETEQCAREEETRILYVAMTRARERLVLLGSAPSVEADGVGFAARRRASRLDLLTAASPLDWIRAVVRDTPVEPAEALEGERTNRGSGRERDAEVFRVLHHSTSAMDRWRVPDDRRANGNPCVRAATRLEPLPEGEPRAVESNAVRDLFERIEYAYPWLSVSSVPATVAASAFAGADDPLRHEAADLVRREAMSEFEWRPRRRIGTPVGAPLDAARVGVATHRALQHFDFRVGASGVASELQRLVGEGRLAEEEAAAIDVDAIAWFLRTDLAGRIRQAGANYRRELMFVSGESPATFDASVESGPGDFVLVRGMVDGILPSPGGLEVVDFKTDRVGSEGVAARAERYSSQVRLYTGAVARLWRRPVTRSILVFLSARSMVAIEV